MPKMKFEKLTYDKIGETLFVGRHTSGLTVYFCPKPEFSETSAMLVANFGSVDNEFRISGEESFTVLPEGVAHFLEHKMFEREDGHDIFADYGKYGAFANAFTSFDRTVYLFSCTQNFEENLKLLLSFLDGPHFTDESIEKEKGIITQEIKMTADNPDWQTTHLALKSVYSASAVKDDIAGTAASVAGISADMLRRANSVFYNPSNMALAVCGNTTAEKIGRIVDECVGKFPPLEVERRYPEEPPCVSDALSKQSLAVAMPQFCIAIKNCDGQLDGEEFAKREAAMAILLEMLAGTSSTLYKKLYDRGVINGEFSAGFLSARTFAITLVSGESERPQEVLDELKSAMAELKVNGVDKQDFARIKKAVYGKNLEVFNRSDSITESIVSHFVTGCSIFDQFNVFQTLSPEDVEAELEKLTDDKIAMSVVEPIKEE